MLNKNIDIFLHKIKYKRDLDKLYEVRKCFKKKSDYFNVLEHIKLDWIPAEYQKKKNKNNMITYWIKKDMYNTKYNELKNIIKNYKRNFNIDLIIDDAIELLYNFEIRQT